MRTISESNRTQRMEKFRKVWTDELNAWLLTTKGMKPGDAYALFLATFPEITDVTRCAFSNQRSRMGAAGKCTNPNFSRKPRPLWSEQIKKGYVRIKIAQPNVWVSKAKWVYMETHPWEDFAERSNYVFLDGDTRNFAPANIERVPLRLMGVFNEMGGCTRGNPEATRLRLLLVRSFVARLDAGERMGLVVRQGTGRKFREERNRKAREYNARPERRRIANERAKIYRARLREENPEEFARQAERHKAYAKEWNKRRKGKKAQ